MLAADKFRPGPNSADIPSGSAFTDRALISRDTACILNAGDRDAQVAITIVFADREPVGPYRVTVRVRRTLHLRFNDLVDPQPVPHDTDASVFERDVLIVIQHTRLDSQPPDFALLSTMASPGSPRLPAVLCRIQRHAAEESGRLLGVPLR